jgi:hypothetical protein
VEHDPKLSRFDIESSLWVVMAYAEASVSGNTYDGLVERRIHALFMGQRHDKLFEIEKLVFAEIFQVAAGCFVSNLMASNRSRSSEVIAR